VKTPRRTFRLPDPVDVDRETLSALFEQLGHDPSTVQRVRITAHEVQVDLVPPRRDIAKLTVTHAVTEPDGVCG